jgi:TonB family protein
MRIGMFVFQLALALLLQSQPVAQDSVARAESSCPSTLRSVGGPPIGAGLASYVSNDDYPPEALARGEQGTTCFSLIVGVDGRVRNCMVTASSGSMSLDETTCRILRERARFRPAMLNTGQPTEDIVHSRMTWRIAADVPATTDDPAAAPE